MKTIGWIGTGVMGQAMAAHLMQNGYTLCVYTRTPSKAAQLIAAGATLCQSAAECVKNADAVFTMVGYPADVEAVYFGADGILQNARAGTYLADMTTTSPQLAIRIEKEARERGLFAVDAPVSGGDVGAKNATLSIMVGGEKMAFEALLPLFACMGKTITHAGAAGAGQHTKMANQIAIAGAVAGVCEALTYAKGAGLSLETVLTCISGGAASSWQLSNMAPRMLGGDFDPGFYVKHFVKDLTIAGDEAALSGLDLAVLNTVRAMYQTLEQQGKGDLGTQALWLYNREKA